MADTVNTGPEAAVADGGRDRVLAGAAAALVPGGTLLVVGHDLANLTEGVGGPSSPDVLYTPEMITAALSGLRILRAERVRRTVQRDGEQVIAIDTLVRAERPASALPRHPRPSLTFPWPHP